MNDDAVMQPLIDALGEAPVAKLLASANFMSSLADKLESNGAMGCNSSTLDNVRQDVYESCKMDIDKSAESTAALQFCRLNIVPLDMDNGTFNSSHTDVVEKVNFLVAASQHGGTSVAEGSP